MVLFPLFRSYNILMKARQRSCFRELFPETGAENRAISLTPEHKGEKMKKLRGLTQTEVMASREKYGTNTLKRQKGKSIFRRFLENLGDPIIKILLIAVFAEVVLTLGRVNYFEVGGIVIAILIATVVSTLSEVGSEAAFAKLEAGSLSAVAVVLREGERRTIPISEIVVGDIVHLCAGNTVHADGYIISGSVTVNQSALNGEGREVTKRAVKFDGMWELENEACVFRGSSVTDGEALMCVGRVGDSTYYGMVAKELQTETRESPLKLRLTRLASVISKIGYVMAALVALTYLFFAYVVDNGFDVARIISSLSDYRGLFSSLLHALTLMITVIVVAVPEGLPMMITVVLSANMKRMLADNILVKKLVGIETAGSMNILFTDKTGTLTRGFLECDRIITPLGSFRTAEALMRYPMLCRAAAVCTLINTDVYESCGEAVGGNATDRAAFEFFGRIEKPNVRVVKKKGFNSTDKYSSVTLEDGMTYIKGAADMILRASRYVYSDSGERVVYDFSGIDREYLTATERGERVIALAVSECGELSNLTLVALVILKDKLRPDVLPAIRELTDAGIQVVMLTGDGLETATAIAEECGIYKRSRAQIAITSRELSALGDEELMAIIPHLRVVARALPTDKSRLVRLSQRMNLVVGMTGDGINDAPSLKLADVGFAMGSGTDVAKGAGDVIILDDSIGAISKTTLYGRTIFKSIRKFITFQLIMNLTACGASLLGQFIGIENPITIIQMLWINIIMDTLGALAFAAEPPLHYYMKEPPKRRDEPILSLDMIKHVAALGVYTLGLCILFLRLDVFRDYYMADYDSTKFLTAFYALFIFSGIFNCFLARCERLNIFSNIGKNKPFIFIMLAISVIQIAMIYFGGTLFRTTPLSVPELLLVIALASSTVVFDILRRIFVRLR